MMRRFRQFPTIGGRRGGIPADCVEVQYLRSTGTQYIDTGIVATQTTGAYWKVKCNTYNDGCLGMYQSSIDMLYIDFYGNGIYFRYGNYASSKITSGFDASGVNEMECKDGSCYLNGESVYDGANTSSIGSDSRTLYIFARNHRGSAAGYALVDLYAHKIYDGSDLVADFVPVRRVENGVSVGYMCDRLTGELYGNQGTGAFVVGPDKGADPYHGYVSSGLVACLDADDGLTADGWTDIVSGTACSIGGNSVVDSHIEIVGTNTFSLQPLGIQSLISGDCTIEIEADVGSLSAYAAFFGVGSSRFYLYTWGASYLYMAVYAGSAVTYARARSPVLYTCVFDSASKTMSIYENGVFKKSAVGTADTGPSTNYLRAQSAGAKFRAIRVYDRQLTSDEIAANVTNYGSKTW